MVPWSHQAPRSESPLTVLAMLLAAQLGAAAPARFALVIGADDGADGEATLHYAQSDARLLGRSLVALGGFAADAVTCSSSPCPWTWRRLWPPSRGRPRPAMGPRAAS